MDLLTLVSPLARFKVYQDIVAKVCAACKCDSCVSVCQSVLGAAVQDVSEAERHERRCFLRAASAG